MFGIVYKVTNKLNKKSYIGQTVRDLENRKSRHIYSAKKGSNLPFHCAIRKYGIDNFDWREVAWGDTLKRLKEYEIRMIDFYGTKPPNGYNLTEGGEGNAGWIPSSETRKKNSESHKNNKEQHFKEGKLNPMCGRRMENHPSFGKKRPDASERMKIYASGRTGKNHPMFGRKGILNPLFGKNLTEDHIRKISESKKGKRRIDMIGNKNPMKRKENKVKISEARKLYWLKRKNNETTS